MEERVVWVQRTKGMKARMENNRVCCIFVLMACKVSNVGQQEIRLERPAETRSRRVLETRLWRCGLADLSLVLSCPCLAPFLLAGDF